MFELEDLLLLGLLNWVMHQFLVFFWFWFFFFGFWLIISNLWRRLSASWTPKSLGTETKPTRCESVMTGADFSQLHLTRHATCDERRLHTVWPNHALSVLENELSSYVINLPVDSRSLIHFQRHIWRSIHMQ